MRIGVLCFIAHTLCLIGVTGTLTESCVPGKGTCIMETPPILLQSRQSVNRTSTDKVTSVAPFDCEQHPGPLQVLKNDEGTAYDVMALEVATGHYTELFTIPFDRTTPEFRTLNACGISPMSSLAYCAMEIGGKDTGTPYYAVLVRFDTEKVEFVARLPGFGTGGAISPSGETFYVIGNKGIYAIESPDSLTGYADLTDPSLTDLRDTEILDFISIDDAAVFTSDAKTGTMTDYVVGIPKITGGLKVAVMEMTGEHQSFLVDAVLLGDSKASEKGAFGAAWSYQNRVFFSNNGGTGILEVDLSSLEMLITENAATVNVMEVGSSDPTGFNDGMNCMGMPPGLPPPVEWESAAELIPAPDTTAEPVEPVTTPTPATDMSTNVAQIDCDALDGPLQVLLNAEGTAYDVMALDVASGHYSEKYSIPLSRTTPAFKKLNSCSISPISSIAYCTLSLGKLGGKGRGANVYELLVRVDAERVEFVARLPWMGTGGGFSPSGETFYITRNGGGVYAVESPDSLIGYEEYNDPSLADLQDTPTYDSPGMDDVAVFTSAMTDYVVGIPKVQGDIKVAIIEMAGEHQSYLVDAISDASVPKNMKGAFGAGWNYQERVFFSSNRGQGVLEVDLISLTSFVEGNSATVTIKKVGVSDPTTNNDGMNCIGLPPGLPPPEEWGPPSTPAPLPDLTPCDLKEVSTKELLDEVIARVDVPVGIKEILNGANL